MSGSPTSASKPTQKSTEALILTLPGKVLDLTRLNREKKFRSRGNREGGLLAMQNLEQEGFGTLRAKKSQGSLKVN